MQNIDSVTLLHDGPSGTIIFIVPNPILFENVDEFAMFVGMLQDHLEKYQTPNEGEIAPDYAEKVIDVWQQHLAENLGKSGPTTPKTKP